MSPKTTAMWKDNLLTALRFAVASCNNTDLEGSTLQKGWEENIKELTEGATEIYFYDNIKWRSINGLQ